MDKAESWPANLGPGGAASKQPGGGFYFTGEIIVADSNLIKLLSVWTDGDASRSAFIWYDAEPIGFNVWNVELTGKKGLSVHVKEIAPPNSAGEHHYTVYVCDVPFDMNERPGLEETVRLALAKAIEHNL